MSEVRWTEIDGVPAAWVEAERRFSVGMTFRAGCCDERLATSGRVHLLEHVVASQLPNPDRLVQASTGGLSTTFTTGADSPDAMADFVRNVCAALTSLDESWFEREVGRILAEEHGRSGSIEGTALQMRYGYRHWGLQDAPQFGVETATLADLERLVAQYFTHENVLLTFVGRPPESLRIDLPQGIRQPIPPLRSYLPNTPAWYVDDCGGVAVTAAMPFAPAGALLLAIASDRLDKALCQDAGVSYDTNVSRFELDSTLDHLLIYADSEPSRREEVTKRFAETVVSLDHVTEAELEEQRRQLVDFTVGRYALTSDEVAEDAIGNAIGSWLLDRPHKSLDAFVAEQSEVTAADVGEYGRLMQQHALWILSDEAPVAEIMGSHVPPSTAARIKKGEDYPTLDASQTLPCLILSDEGVSMLDEGNESVHVDVHFSDVEALRYFDDGGLMLMVSEGTDMLIEPTLWFSGAEISRKVRASVPNELQFGLGTRPPEDIPRPSTRTGRLLGRLFGK